jgi:hypothetical protein
MFCFVVLFRHKYVLCIGLFFFRSFTLLFLGTMGNEYDTFLICGWKIETFFPTKEVQIEEKTIVRVCQCYMKFLKDFSAKFPELEMMEVHEKLVNTCMTMMSLNV